MNVIEELQNYILTELAFDQNRKSIEPDEDLLGQGIVDSSGIIQLAEFMEDKFGIQIGDEDIVPENFQSIDALERLIQAKQEK